MGEGRWGDGQDGTYREKRKGRMLRVKNEEEKVRPEYAIFLVITTAPIQINVFFSLT